ncbi:hypothetical protein BX600DRAFT_506168 [Xylariales sp. PMI_506]|nr:hypothetical protein BX600DRAFT_506168 [Xylariales sp. PMI_506]
MLTEGQKAEAREHFKSHGWVRIPSLLSKEEAEQFLQKLWAAKEIAEARGEDTHLAYLDPNPSNACIFYLMEFDKVFRDLLFHPTALDMAEAVLGTGVIISNFTANIARPGSRSMALHSDQSLVFEEPWKGAGHLPENAPELLVPFEAKAGDIIAMEGRVWHTSGSNVTENEDRALLFGYYTSSHIRQQVNWTAKVPKEIQDTLSPEQKT